MDPDGYRQMPPDRNFLAAGGPGDARSTAIADVHPKRGDA
jgi:hypothetical protein